MGTASNNPTCTHCGSTKSPLWRRGVHSEILCNACGLYWKHHGTYRPLSLKMAADRKDTPRAISPLGDAGLPAKRDSNLRRLKSTLASSNSSMDSTARRKSSAGKIALPSSFFLQTQNGRWRGEPVFAPELPPSTGTANVRLVPADIRESGSLDAVTVHSEIGAPLAIKADMIPAKYIMFRGRLLFIGDHVAVRGDDAQIYFAIVHDFWIVPTGLKYVKLQWLLPKSRYALEIDGPKERLDPHYFTLGPMHDRAELIESIVDVFFSPQQIRQPLEDSTPPPQVPSLGQYTSSRRSSLESPLEPLLTERRIASDSELDYGKVGLEMERRKPPALVNILDDVEMAHLLCSMS